MNMSGLVRLSGIACSQPSAVKPALLCLAVHVNFDTMTTNNECPPVGGDPDPKERARAFAATSLQQKSARAAHALFATTMALNARSSDAADHCSTDSVIHKPETTDSYDLMKFMVGVMLSCVLVGLVLGWHLHKWFCGPVLKKRSVKTQSQTHYSWSHATPRFTVVPDRDQGAFLDFKDR
jgi:hypothetical protein